MRAGRRIVSAGAVFVLLAAACSRKPAPPVEVAATPEIAGSGLAQALLTVFQRQTGVVVHLRTVPEAEAFRLANAREVQVVFTADSAAAERYGSLARLSGRFAFHDFAIFAPRRDPAHVRYARSGAAALKAIAQRRAAFCSAVDVPRVREREERLWKLAEIDPASLKRTSPCRGNALEALETAGDRSAYALAEPAVGAALGKQLGSKPFLAGAADLHDEYSAILIEHSPHVRRDRDAEWLMQWLMSYQGRDAIQNIRLDGVQVFSVRNTD